MKVCTKCKIEKTIDSFHISKVNKDNLSNWCKSCKRDYDKQYRKTDKVQEYYKSSNYKDKKLKYKNANYLKVKLSSIRSNCSERGLEFSITENDLTIVEYCPLLNIKLDYEVGKGRKNWNTASIDRIDNTKGYIPGNVWIISKLANTMKSISTIEQLLVFSKNSIKIFKQ